MIDRWQSQPDPQFFAGGIPLLAWYVLAILGLAAVLRWRARPAPAFGAVLALAMGAVPVPLLLTGVAAVLLDPSWFLGAALAAGIYVLLYLARGLRAMTGETQRVAACAGLLFIAGFGWITDALDAIPDVWNPLEPQTARQDDAPADSEALLFGQSARIDLSLGAVGRGTSAEPQAFFLGFAGVGDEKVFAQEIGLASRVLGERYAIDGRSLSLINDERDLERAPLATVSGLKYALRGLGARMNRDRDVLFLSISSHGAEDPAVIVSNSQLPLNDLTDEDLADALRESGIKWRVIIISACYAGGFIDALKRPANHRHHGGRGRPDLIRLFERSRPDLLRRGVLSGRIARRPHSARGLRHGQSGHRRSGTPGTRHTLEPSGLFRRRHGSEAQGDARRGALRLKVPLQVSSS